MTVEHGQKSTNTQEYNKMKQGYKTTEFWLTILGLIAGALVATGVLTENEGVTLQEAVVGLVMAILPIWQYIQSRTAVKVASLK